MTLLRRDKPMMIEEFLAFTEVQPGDERWELIDGEPIVNPSPTFNHQTIVLNLTFELELLARKGAQWGVLPGIGVRLSQTNMPVPDVLLRPTRRATGHYCDDIIVAFEVPSPSSRSMDLHGKRIAYPKLPSLQHYVVIHQDEVRVRCFDRAANWADGSSDLRTGCTFGCRCSDRSGGLVFRHRTVISPSGKTGSGGKPPPP